MECLIIFKVIFFNFFLKQKIEWGCFNSLDSAFHNLGPQEFYSIFASKYGLRKYYVTNRVVPIWNSLPNEVVTADNPNFFNKRLDKFWLLNDFFLNLYRAQPLEAGSVK